MKRIFACSPFAGNTERNIEMAKRLCMEIIKAGHAPFAPHLIYPLLLDDDNSEQRQFGLQAGLIFLESCHELWYCADFGISYGMRKEIEKAKELHIRRRKIVGLINGKDVVKFNCFKRYLKSDQLPWPRRNKNGRLCKWCGSIIPKGRQSWCSNQCVNEFLIRNGQSRETVFKRDKGICSECGLDTVRFQERIDALWEKYSYTNKSDELFRRIKRLKGLANFKFLSTYWHVDHIVPVILGGGCCGMDNLRTLCIWCHKKHTADLMHNK